MLVKDRPRLTKQALESIGSTDDMTVMIRDDSKVENWNVVEDFTQKNSIKGRICYHISHNVGTGFARNDVIETSEQAFGRGDYLYLSDNDVFFQPGWLDKLIKCYECAWQYGFRVVGAYNHPFHHPIDGEPWVAIPHFRSLAESLMVGSPVEPEFIVKPVLALALQSMLMRWEVWDEFGPFNATTPGRVCDGEDVAFGNKIRETGGKLGVVSPALLVNCGITNSFGQKIPGWELVRDQAPAGVYIE